MISCFQRHSLRSLCRLAAASLLVLCWPVSAQWPMQAPVTTPDAQRTALNGVRSQAGWLQNATRTAPSYGDQGYASVARTFEGLRMTYGQFKQTLTPQQLAYGANAFAELDAGLDIIQEAFRNYEEDIAGGAAVGPALRNMCQLLRQGSALWLQELNKTCSKIRVGWG